MMIGKLFGTAPVLKKQLEIYQPKFGDLNLGYDGVVNSRQFITRTALMAQIGELGIVRMYGYNADWFKFYLGGKTLMVAASPIGITTSYNGLNSKGLMQGQRTVTVLGKQYKTRSLTGANGNLSEWNRLMYRIATGSPIAAGDRWDTIDPGQLTKTADGKTAIWSISPDPVGVNVSLRGRYTVMDEFTINTNAGYSDVGWRPVLELIG